MLRTISEIAEAVNLHKDRIRNLIRKEKIIPTHSRPFRFDEYQQDYIFRIIYMEQRTEYITLPSKMNIPEPEVTLPVYSRLDFIKNGNLTPSNGINL